LSVEAYHLRLGLIRQFLGFARTDLAQVRAAGSEGEALTVGKRITAAMERLGLTQLADMVGVSTCALVMGLDGVIPPQNFDPHTDMSSKSRQPIGAKRPQVSRTRC
jgi:hypothetical protein